MFSPGVSLTHSRDLVFPWSGYACFLLQLSAMPRFAVGMFLAIAAARYRLFDHPATTSRSGCVRACGDVFPVVTALSP